MAELIFEYRGGVLENVRPGRICVTGEQGEVLYSVGDPAAMTYFRSTSKPLQALPVIIRGLDVSYGLAEKELAVIASSHKGEPMHLETVFGLLEKTGFSESDMIVSASHNCSGKHIGTMLLQRYLTGSCEGYWEPDSAAQKEILEIISCMTSVPEQEIAIGVDGCGVPVFAVPQKNIALSYMRLVCPDRIGRPEVRRAAEKITRCMNENPLMIAGTGSLCSLLNEDQNIIAKSGAQGIYAFGLKKERLGVAIKNEDGSERWAVTVAEILRQLGYDNRETIEKLERHTPTDIFNDINIKAGVIRPAFKLQKP